MFNSYDEWEAKYDNLLRKYEKLQRSYNELNDRYKKLDQTNDHNEFRIRNELEPMIASKNRAYDAWATDPERGSSNFD